MNFIWVEPFVLNRTCVELDLVWFEPNCNHQTGHMNVLVVYLIRRFRSGCISIPSSLYCCHFRAAAMTLWFGPPIEVASDYCRNKRDWQHIAGLRLRWRGFIAQFLQHRRKKGDVVIGFELASIQVGSGLLLHSSRVWLCVSIHNLCSRRRNSMVEIGIGDRCGMTLFSPLFLA